MLGVSDDTLREHGAVSENTVREMVVGVQRVMGARCAVATSGVAGPSGGTAEKPVGTVWTAVAVGDKVVTRLLQLGDEGRVRNVEKTVAETLAFLLKIVGEE